MITDVFKNLSRVLGVSRGGVSDTDGQTEMESHILEPQTDASGSRDNFELEKR